MVAVRAQAQEHTILTCWDVVLYLCTHYNTFELTLVTRSGPLSRCLTECSDIDPPIAHISVRMK